MYGNFLRLVIPGHFNAWDYLGGGKFCDFLRPQLDSGCLDTPVIFNLNADGFLVHYGLQLDD